MQQAAHCVSYLLDNWQFWHSRVVAEVVLISKLFSHLKQVVLNWSKGKATSAFRTIGWSVSSNQVRKITTGEASLL